MKDSKEYVAKENGACVKAKVTLPFALKYCCNNNFCVVLPLAIGPVNIIIKNCTIVFFVLFPRKRYAPL